MKTVKALKLMPYAQAHIEIENGTIDLWSYSTKVATIKDGCLYVYGLYSMTTRKHIRAFVREFIKYELSFELIKYLANNSDTAKYVIDTREIIDTL